MMNNRVLKYDKEKPLNKPFLSIPSNINKVLNFTLSRNAVQFRLMIFLVGQKEGLKITANYVRKETGIDNAEFSKAVKALEKLKYITCTKDSIQVNLEYIAGLEESLNTDYLDQDLDNIIQMASAALM